MKPRTFRAEKEFGLIVGGVFALLGSGGFIVGSLRRRRMSSALAGSTLVLCGSGFPRLLTVPRKFWMKLAEAMAYVSSRIILAIIFFLVLTPIGLVKRAMGWDPLQRRSAHATRSGNRIPARESTLTTRKCFSHKKAHKSQAKKPAECSTQRPTKVKQRQTGRVNLHFRDLCFVSFVPFCGKSGGLCRKCKSLANCGSS